MLAVARRARGGACTAVGARAAPRGPRSCARDLELRRTRTTDASAYAELFADPAVAVDARVRRRHREGAPPIPAWRAPYVSGLETSSDADVVVVWRASKEHQGLAAATVFRLQLVDGSWRIADALPLETSTTPKPLSQPNR